MRNHPLPLPLLFIALIQTGCVGLYGKRSTYVGSGAEVNGAQVSMLVKPEGTSGGTYSMNAMIVGVAVANLDGPFRWRIEAEGKEGVHQAMYVRRLRTVTSLTKRDEWFPEKWLGVKTPFVKKNSYAPGVVKAAFHVPGYLAVKPKEDGALDVFADVIIEANGRRERKMIKFHLDPAEKSQNETIFLPAEIVTGISTPMSEWEEAGWDR